ncbi:orexigenic neuropeptide QRFP [Nyctibius grandis]|uniref:orexigenic neuropeptide QRFP n=1 Tax=Nyctibius grandis TaxID=48427 RepID=UPI0035BBFEDB
MKAPYSLSCLFLLSLGACFPPSERQEAGDPREGTLLQPSWQAAAVAEDVGGCWRAGAKRSHSEELGTLLGIAQALRGYGPEGSRGRQRGSGLLPRGGEKRSGVLGSLAEELSSYSRRKGGFTFRFGR